MNRRSPPLALLAIVLATWIGGRAGYVAMARIAGSPPPSGDIRPLPMPGFMIPLDLLEARSDDDFAMVLPSRGQPRDAPREALMVKVDAAGPALEPTSLATVELSRYAALQLLMLARATRADAGRSSFVSQLPRLSERDHALAKGYAARAPFTTFLTSDPPASHDRWTGGAWAFHRAGGLAAPLPGAASLGGSQAGARIAYRIGRADRIEAFARVSTAGRRASGAQAALGLSVRPLRAVPISLVAERRQALGGNGDGSAFAAYAVGGLSDAALPSGWRLDAYGAAGVVGARRRDGFAEGATRITRALARFGAVTLGGGGGLWAGAQTDAARLDVGPTLSARIDHIAPRLAVDFRQRIAGDARPASGVAVTLAADF